MLASTVTVHEMIDNARRIPEWNDMSKEEKLQRIIEHNEHVFLEALNEREKSCSGLL